MLLLQDVHDLFVTSGTAVLASASIVQKLVQMEERPWPEYRHGKEISPRGLAALLGHFGVKPKTHRIDSDTTAKAYARSQLQPVFDTYLAPIPALLSVTSVTSADVTDVTDRNEGVRPSLSCARPTQMIKRDSQQVRQVLRLTQHGEKWFDDEAAAGG